MKSKTLMLAALTALLWCVVPSALAAESSTFEALLKENQPPLHAIQRAPPAPRPVAAARLQPTPVPLWARARAVRELRGPWRPARPSHPNAGSRQNEAGERPSLFRDQPDVILANGINLLAASLFLTRVHAPAVARVLGPITLATAVPAVGLVTYNVARRRPFVQSLPAISWVAFSAMALTVDYLLDVEFRKPTRWAVLLPYLALFYGSTVAMWGTTWRHGLPQYLVTTATWALMTGASIYGRVHE